MTIYIHYWLRLLLWVFIGLGALSGVIIIVKEKMKELLEKGKLGNGWKRNFLVITGERITQQTNKIVIFVIGLLMGGSLGYGYREHQLVSNTRIYFGVSIVSQNNDRSYLVLIPGYSKLYEWDFCHPLKMPGALIDIKYEQHNGCKQVNGTGFVQIHKENNNVELSTGRDSSSTTTSSKLE